MISSYFRAFFRHLRRTPKYIQDIPRKTVDFYVWMLAPKKLYYRIPLVGIVLLLLFSLFSQLFGGSTEESLPDPLREVTLISLSEAGLDIGPLRLVGETTALQQADLRAESGGRVTSVSKKIGDRVAAGEIIAQFENARERAAVLQGEGAVEGAEAMLLRVLKGSRGETLEILGTSKEQAEKSLATTKESTVNTLRSIYASNDDAIRSKIDGLFSNPQTNAPKFLLSTSDSRLVLDIEVGRPTIETLLVREQVRKNTLSADADLEKELLLALEETRTILASVDQVTNAINRAIPSTAQPQEIIAGYSGAVAGARGVISGNLSIISGTTQELSGKIAASKISGANLTQGSAPAKEDVLQGEAGLKQARGAYALALAQLEKTIIRSPISGSLDALNIHSGDYVLPGASVASVSNTSGMEISTSVTEEDIAATHVGAEVTLDNGMKGVVTRVGSGLDAVTKKVGVRIAIDDPKRVLQNGASIGLSISRGGHTNPTESDSSEMTLPLSAVKLYADRSVIFTVEEGNLLVEHLVELGPLLGDRVIILSGTQDLTVIVKDARGLRGGQEVTIKQ